MLKNYTASAIEREKEAYINHELNKCISSREFWFNLRNVHTKMNNLDLLFLGDRINDLNKATYSKKENEQQL